MLEAYTGSKPGRRTTLLIMVALVLAGALALAWSQVRATRTLGPPIAIRGTPLLVRLPAQWKQDPHKPTAFVLPTRGDSRQQTADFERRISFQYERTAGFRPPLTSLKALAGRRTAEPARIGPFAAVQVRQKEHRRWGFGESILRSATLPNGDVVSVLYLPMSALTMADLELLDAICKAVQFNDPGLSVGWAEACGRAGIALAADESWRAVLPAVPEAPGLFVGGAVHGIPTWSLGIFRTWLSTGRDATGLLKDFAAEYWLLNQVQVTTPDWKRDDGASIALVRHPALARNRRPISAAALVVQSPAQAVLIFVYSDEQSAAAAVEAAERAARTIQILPAPGIPEPAAAEEAGREFAAKLASAGAVPWWGKLPVKLKLAGITLRGTESISVVREPLGRNPVRGYRGSSLVTVAGYEELTRWEAMNSGRYEFKTQIEIGDGQIIESHETRAGRDEPVKRLVVLNEMEHSRSSFRPGPAFISPPFEVLAESWVAREAAGALISEFSTLLAGGTHSCLLRPLPPEDGYARVLVQRDYWPAGEILGFDESGELQFLRSAIGELRRVTNRRS